MTKTLAEARDYAGGLAEAILDRPELAGSVQAFIIPPHTALAVVAEELRGVGERRGVETQVILGAQNAHWEESGAWTGEISVPQAADAGARLVEIGHSERREHFGETVETTRLKVRTVLDHGLRPLLCVGEPREVREAGEAEEFILAQARGALAGLDSAQLARVLLAYEPIWAIGEQGRPATVEELAEPFAALERVYGAQVEAVLYGGSVNQDNAAELLEIPGVDGLFVGRAAWGLDGYLELLETGASHVRGAHGRLRQ
ncbi:triose-phosphate isomerase [Nesterenkonia xinjiangensis]|uniref:Triosephosphate isomerase n=1 Tax=Nesterenkonia xinjiangensis TaxID=225327 RepID=A0A7Z0GLD4_9MICC|nr:triosephosphate isomerase [Nesterenkonia xinjiangensis]